MSAVFRIARREVRERRVLLWAGLGLSLLAATLHVLPGVGGGYGLGELLAILLLLAYPPAVALAVGSSLIGRDLALGRLSFYFSRPLSSGAVWAGKFLGGAALVIGAFLCCLIPLVLSSGSLAREAIGFWILLLLGLMALAHVTTSMYRSGSWLFALDLGLGALFVAVLGIQLRNLASAGAGDLLFGLEPLGGVIGVALTVATVGMLAAAGAQLVYGRADAHRGHVALSAAVWTFALASLGGLGLWGSWLLRVTPDEVGGVGDPLFAAPRGTALFFHGTSWHGRAGFSPIFLMNGRSGSYVRLPLERVTPPVFAADGRTAAWVAPEAPWGNYLAPDHHLTATRAAWQATPVAPIEYGGLALAVARLDGDAPAVEERRLDLPDAVSMALALDSDGQRVLLSGRSSVLLLDTATVKLLASTAIAGVVAAEFLADGAVRLYQKESAGPGRAALVVLDWSPKDGSRVDRGRAAGDRSLFLLARRGDLAVVSAGAREKALIDAGRGAVRRFDSAGADLPGAALVLSTGQVALSLGDEVRIVTRDGQTVASIPLEPRTQVYGLHEPQPGELAIGIWTPALAKRRTLFVDAATGTVRREENEILPAGPRERGLPAAEPGSFASRLFTDLDGALIALEVDGRRRVIVAARQ